MSNVEADPVAVRCGASVEAESTQDARVEVLTARDVPLGGVRALHVRRTIPQRARTLIGAWCFADHYGPVDVPASGGMNVPPHPHTGLSTVSWLFSGVVEHRDSLGTRALVRPGEINLMTGGYGICHSEVSTPDTTVLHGVQLWVALPEAHRDAPRDFQHHVPEPVRVDGAEIRVFIGTLAGDTSPVRTSTALLGAQIDLDPGARITLDADPAFEHGLLVDAGDVRFDDAVLRPTELGYAPSGTSTLTLVNESETPARTILLGGPPFDEAIVMWWNFIGRSHDDIVQAREDWEAATDRFGAVEGYPGHRLPAPALPNAVITPRANPPRRTTETKKAGHAMNETPTAPIVDRVDEQHRYEILVDGERAGLTDYRDRGDQRVFYHTEVDDAHAGQGLAAILVERALTDVRESGKRIVPVCPYVAKFLKRRTEFADIADPVTPEILQWLDTPAD